MASYMPWRTKTRLKWNFSHEKPFDYHQSPTQFSKFYKCLSQGSHIWLYEWSLWFCWREVTPVGFTADMRLLFRDTFLVQMGNSLTYPVVLTVDRHLALLFFQLLHLRTIVNTPTQGRNRTGFGLAIISSHLFERGLLWVRGLQASCRRRVCQESLCYLTVPCTVWRIALLLGPRSLIHDAHEGGIARPVLSCTARDLVNHLIFHSSIWSLDLEALWEAAAWRQTTGWTWHLDAARWGTRRTWAGKGSWMSHVTHRPTLT